MYTITEIEDAIIATLKASEMGAYCKKIDSYQIEGGDLEEQIRLFAGQLPCVLVMYTPDGADCDYSFSGVEDEPMVFSILACAQNLRGKGTARRGVYDMLEDLRAALVGKNCGLDMDPLLRSSPKIEINTKNFSAYSMDFKTRRRNAL